MVIAELRIPNKINDCAVATLTIENPYHYLDELYDEDDDEDFIEEEHGNLLMVNYGFSENWINNKRSKNIYSDSSFYDSYLFENMGDWGLIEALMKEGLTECMILFF